MLEINSTVQRHITNNLIRNNPHLELGTTHLKQLYLSVLFTPILNVSNSLTNLNPSELAHTR